MISSPNTHGEPKSHRHYYRSLVWQGDLLAQTPVWKCPPDMWVYQELLHEVRPDLIVETGTRFGRSAYFLASMCELLGARPSDLGRHRGTARAARASTA